MFRSLVFEPLISPALWITVAILSIALLIWYGWKPAGSLPRARWWPIMGLSAAATAAVLFILLNPTWLETIPPPAGKPLLTILVDATESMQTRDTDNETSRFRTAAEKAQAIAEELDARFEVRLRQFSDSTQPVDVQELPSLAASGETSDLARAILESFAEDRPQGQAIVLLSDGIHNGPGGIDALQQELRIAKAMTVPIYPYPVGSESVGLNDVAVGVQRSQELSYVGQQLPITVSLKQSGGAAGTTKVTLLRDGEEVDSIDAPLTTDGVSTVQFDIECAEAGVYRYEVRADSFPQEAVAENNTAPLILRVIEDPIRVMLLEGKPYWDAKFLIRTLASDPSLELDAFVRVSERRFLKREIRLTSSTSAAANGGDAAVSRTETSEVIGDPGSILEDPDLLDDYQVVVLGRDAEVFLTEEMLERLRMWVSQDGGSLICYRGAPVTNVDPELSRLMPVNWTPSRESRFRLQATDRGENVPWLTAGADYERDSLGKLPSLATQTQPDRLKPLAVVLARAESNDESSPVVTYQSYGVGRVVVIEGSGMWRWAFLAPQFQSHEHVYQQLWQSLLRWLVSSLGLTPGQNLALRTDRIEFKPEEPVTALLLMREETEAASIPKVQLTGADGAALQTVDPVPLGDEPGVYQVLFGRLPEGNYRATVLESGGTPGSASKSIALDVRKDYRERIETAARPDIMQYIARESGGVLLETGDAAEVISQFEAHSQQTRPQRMRRITAWDRWWILLAVFVLWGTAWGLRRSSGLI